jgi:hypothetical protein
MNGLITVYRGYCVLPIGLINDFRDEFIPESGLMAWEIRVE